MILTHEIYNKIKLYMEAHDLSEIEEGGFVFVAQDDDVLSVVDEYGNVFYFGIGEEIYVYEDVDFTDDFINILREYDFID